MNDLNLAWEVTNWDIVLVAEKLGYDINEDVADSILNFINCSAVTQAALQGDEFDIQTTYAYEEILAQMNNTLEIKNILQGYDDREY